MKIYNCNWSSLDNHLQQIQKQWMPELNNKMNSLFDWISWFMPDWDVINTLTNWRQIEHVESDLDDLGIQKTLTIRQDSFIVSFNYNQPNLEVNSNDSSLIIQNMITGSNYYWETNENNVWNSFENNILTIHDGTISASQDSYICFDVAPLEYKQGFYNITTDVGVLICADSNSDKYFLLNKNIPTGYYIEEIETSVYMIYDSYGIPVVISDSVLKNLPIGFSCIYNFQQTDDIKIIDENKKRIDNYLIWPLGNGGFYLWNNSFKWQTEYFANDYNEYANKIFINITPDALRYYAEKTIPLGYTTIELVTTEISTPTCVQNLYWVEDNTIVPYLEYNGEEIIFDSEHSIEYFSNDSKCRQNRLKVKLNTVNPFSDNLKLKVF